MVKTLFILACIAALCAVAIFTQMGGEESGPTADEFVACLAQDGATYDSCNTAG